MIMRS